MTNNIKNNHIDLQELTSRLNKEDRKNERLTKRLTYFYFGFSIVYALAYMAHAIFDTNNFTLTDGLSGASYIVAFILFAILFKRANKEYREVDYALPTIQMLSKAAKRYKLFNAKLPLALLAALFVNIAISLSQVKDTINRNFINDILTAQIIFFTAIVIGFVIGIIVWYNRQKPIRDNALALINELEN